MDDIDKLVARLAHATPGRLTGPDVTDIESLLACCWEQLKDSDGGGMTDAKLSRTEDLRWDPPILRFEVERHGKVVKGAKRAEIQHWRVDLQQRVATLGQVTLRQLYPNAAPMNVKSIADDIASAIAAGIQDNRFSRHGNVVSVRITVIIPLTNKQTTAGRRRRFVTALEQQLAPLGWRRTAARNRLDFEFQPVT